MKTIHTSILAAVLAIGLPAAAVALAVYSGVYNVAADEPHTRPIYSLLETARARSIAVRASELRPPSDLGDETRIRQGAGNYAAMCAGCHLAPGGAPTELSRGLYPAPPDLTRKTVSAAEAFWAIKHGIKASGMPAWGKSMQDEYIWNMAAFLQKLPTLDEAQYQAWVAGSGGHSHGGGETGGHAHAPAQREVHDDTAEPAHAEKMHANESGAAEQGATPDAGTRHAHADGLQHLHAPKATPAEPGPQTTTKAKSRTQPQAADPHEGKAMPETGRGTQTDPAHDDVHDHQH
jgi:mono/diheme cytochrome c family protein